jgi:hypothetical protein
MKQLHIALTFALVLLLPAIVVGQQLLPPHDSVGKRFVPSDVDFGQPDYEVSFDHPDELKDWKLEGGDVARVTDEGDLLLKSEMDSIQPQNSSASQGEGPFAVHDQPPRHPRRSIPDHRRC